MLYIKWLQMVKNRIFHSADNQVVTGMNAGLQKLHVDNQRFTKK